MTTYKELLGVKESDTEQKDLSNLLKKAWEIRNFEIELFWKRTAYFSTIVGALFVSYYTAKSELCFIAFLGSISSLVWLLSNLGSKFWQENWEKHIDLLEEETKSGDIYKVVLMDNRYMAYSVSKLSIFLSAIIFISWIYLYLVALSPALILANCNAMLSISILLILIGIILLTCRTSFKEKENKIEGSKASYYKRKT